MGVPISSVKVHATVTRAGLPGPTSTCGTPAGNMAGSKWTRGCACRVVSPVSEGKGATSGGGVVTVITCPGDPGGPVAPCSPCGPCSLQPHMLTAMTRISNDRGQTPCRTVMPPSPSLPGGYLPQDVSTPPLLTLKACLMQR